MNDCERLAAQLTRALDGDAWHGPAWREVLATIPVETARARAGTAHTIAEIVAHAATWHDVVRRRLSGESPRVTEADDWPAAEPGDAAAWAHAVARLLDTGHALRDAVASFPADRLHARRSGLEGTWFDLVAGALQHTLYHAGQVPVLARALEPPR